MRFTINYRPSRGYTVSVANYAGGEVVTADEADRYREALEKIKLALCEEEWGDDFEAVVVEAVITGLGKGAAA